jgi:hypothetical protein
MKRPPKSRPPQDQTACVRLILWVLLNDSSSLQSLQDFIYPDDSKGFRLHLSPGMIREAAVIQAAADLLVIHSLSRTK